MFNRPTLSRRHHRQGMGEPCKPNVLRVVHRPFEVMKFGRPRNAKPRIQPKLQREIFHRQKFIWGVLIDLDWAEQSLIEGDTRVALSMLRAARDCAIAHAEETFDIPAEEVEEDSN